MTLEIHNNQNISEQLCSLEPGKLPREVFEEVARLTVTPVIELIVLVSGKILLTRRPFNDTYWPNKYALPGKIIASGDFDTIDQYVASLKNILRVVGEEKFCNNWRFQQKEV